MKCLNQLEFIFIYNMWRWTNFIPICKYPLLPVSFVDENFLVPLCVIGTFYQKQLYINVSASFFVSYTIPFVYVSTFYSHKILFSSVNFTLGFDYVACVWICTFFLCIILIFQSFWFHMNFMNFLYLFEKYHWDFHRCCIRSHWLYGQVHNARAEPFWGQ